eukprot:TRINITY_DN3526_c0_g1_i2.p1 TRINITY_DN3526_c0_g1~~TRINITY_DN3526_c0_g1_i2.p1  ORF type:complete len:214 (+),score=36.38 TRINITY_DN3526_c0_g1_i2:333-974(+)
MPMEVEVKLRLGSQEAHDKVLSCLKDSQRALHQQENFFFDGANRELSSQRMVLRVRFYNESEKALLTLKAKMIMQDGVGRAMELEETLDPTTARDYLEHPSKLLELDFDMIKKLKEDTQVSELKCLGGFKNVRKEITWEGELLELDETRYDWGTVHEIECETSQPEAVRDKLQEFLKEKDIEFKWNTTTKFANFINRTLDQYVVAGEENCRHH